ncbi:uncharacterized protein LOC144545013 [Carex rostrata]
MSNDAQQFEEWVVNIGDKHNEPFSNIPTESLQASTDSEENPSIFTACDDGRLIYFRSYYLHPDFGLRKSCRGWQFVAFMRRWFDLDVGSYLEYIQEKEHIALGYYREKGSFYSKEVFREYLLINSCILVFVILLFQNVQDGIEILSGTKEKRRDPKDQRSIEFYILYQYIMEDSMKIKLQMLTMDYQIPWFLVECMYKKHSNLSELVGTPINELAFSCFDDLYPGVHRSKVHGGTGIGTLPPGGFKHLLHIFHWTRTPAGKYQGETRSLLKPTKKMDNFYVPTATDLKLSATVFEKHAGIHVSFHDRRLSGVMEIAPLHIFKYSISIYNELLEFERGYMDCGFPVTAYVACIVYLLHTEGDVRILRANGIIPSMGNDENDVLCSVKELKELICWDDIPMSDDLYDFSKKVRAHHERPSSKYYGEFKSRYCANPWIAISVVAGVCLFFLTFFQSVIQAVFGTLSYLKH